MTTREELAQRLHGRKYGDEITTDEEKEARESGLIVIFGASDDLCELRGAIHDEVGASDGCTLLFSSEGQLLQPIEKDDEDILRKYDVLEAVQVRRAVARTVKAHWCATKEYSWTFTTDIPHATFDILEDGEKFCRGIVINELWTKF